MRNMSLVVAAGGLMALIAAGSFAITGLGGSGPRDLLAKHQLL